MNLFVDDGEWEIDDSQNTLKEYQDSNTDSGNTIQVCPISSPKQVETIVDIAFPAMLLRKVWKVKLSTT